MKVWRTYRCENADGAMHFWEEFGEDTELGHEAMLGKHLTCPTCGADVVESGLGVPSGEVEITIRPASTHTLHGGSRQLQGQDSYYFVISDVGGLNEKCSSKTYSWDEAMLFAARFRSKERDEAEKWWERYKLSTSQDSE